ncbi:hypothetical protein BN1110_05265 [bacterium YEK0313]|nr:hypothetical protein BN1110_05265 [bacterium YEK0313]
MLDAVAGEIEEADGVGAGLFEPFAQAHDGGLENGLAGIDQEFGVEIEIVQRLGDEARVTGRVLQAIGAIGAIADNQGHPARRWRGRGCPT